jgi:hypothetical protein
MIEHKFKVGQLVDAGASLFEQTLPGPYDITRLLPPFGKSDQNRRKSLKNGHERVVREEGLFRSDH